MLTRKQGRLFVAIYDNEPVSNLWYARPRCSAYSHSLARVMIYVRCKATPCSWRQKNYIVSPSPHTIYIFRLWYFLFLLALWSYYNHILTANLK